ncbi:MAG TPA: 1-deoxy-D-xylulose-5-phosphate reductoisomerase [Actinomycetota bacterium]
MRRIAILGSTGSIGTQALDVVRKHPDRFRVVGLVAGSNAELLAQQRDEFAPSFAALVSQQPDALDEAAVLDEADVVLNAVVGSRGLSPTIAALDADKIVALANKESLIAGGELVTSRARPGRLLPVDSEHSALYQCLAGNRLEDVRRVIITASGGPFRGRTREQLAAVTLDEALRHPTWNMGRKITVDSATLMNKGLEAIEAHHLFGLSMERVEVVVHPRSIVHGIVEFVDGSCIVQASRPDMRLPIQLALGWPERLADGAEPLDWPSLGALAFEPVDHEAFPALELAYDAARRGGTCPAVLNAANEEAVEAFLEQRIAYLDIVEIVRDVLAEHRPGGPPTLDSVLDAERWARAAARAKADA